MAPTPGPWWHRWCQPLNTLIVEGGSPAVSARVASYVNNDNAALIAAAPDLLAACKLALDVGPNGHVCWCDELGSKCDNCIIADAINKAEGRAE